MKRNLILVMTALTVFVGGSLILFGQSSISGGAGVSTAAQVVALFNSGTCSGYLKSNGNCDTPAGGITGTLTANRIPYGVTSSTVADTDKVKLDTAQNILELSGGGSTLGISANNADANSFFFGNLTPGTTNFVDPYVEIGTGSGAVTWNLPGASAFTITGGKLTLPSTPGESTGDIPLCLSTVNVVHTAAVTCGTSAFRFKESIAPSTKGLAWLMRMKPVTFRYKQNQFRTWEEYEGQTPTLGFIADNLAKIQPTYFGAYSQDGKIMNYRDRAVMATTVKAVQEQQAEIIELKREIAELKRSLGERAAR